MTGVGPLGEEEGPQCALRFSSQEVRWLIARPEPHGRDDSYREFGIGGTHRKGSRIRLPLLSVLGPAG